MPRRLDTSGRVEDLGRAIHRLVLSGGIAAVTYRALGEQIGCSASSIHDHFPRISYLLKIVVVRSHATWLRDASFDVRRDGLVALLPRTEPEVDRLRVWLAHAVITGLSLARALAAEVPLDVQAAEAALRAALEGLAS